ncbi:cytochrome c oxidase-assembly factor COX23, mitochondrial [Kwoniella shandongensis]|uniref:Cytochrome c oxidase-assembly factor COX23, mitochondrial n=1 Tax=Kwoniella shandongensis TaxID=1734106 RepID=A0A5M6C5Y6_9TREE|nr:cytochrome c oxidase-assembly factor COX23, mitochondrial [Kwoniella shandongensis]KAA5528599.1 cytochrome c oxidase-assembly factor COX23, mitochondrial [Kwoniella shandongensis]
MATQVPPSKNPTPYASRPLPPSPALEQPEDYKNTFRGRMSASKYADPCEAASKASLECLERTHYNRDECMDFFKAYRECKGKWIAQRKEDRVKGRDTV